MFALQEQVFRWAALQPGLSGLAIFLIGIAFAFFGFRLFSGLLALICAGLGWLVGVLFAEPAGLPSNVLSAGLMVVLPLISIRWKRMGVTIASAAAWATVSLYLADQAGLRSTYTLVAMVTGGALGALMTILCPRTMSVFLMTIVGTMLLVVGFVSLTSSALPSLGETFRSWASSQSLVVPVLMIMVFVAGYSFQSSQQQGDILTGVT